MNAIQLEDIHKAYGQRRILNAVSLTIERGRCTGLSGPSGCGKTTLLRIIAGLGSPDRGSVSLAGTRVSDGRRILTPPERRQLSMVFQDLGLWAHLDARAHVMLALTRTGLSRSERRRSATSWLERMELTDCARRRPRDLSGGERQRLALARALCTSPRFLLLDEPLGHLAAPLKGAMLALLAQELERADTTTLYVTHDADEVARLGATSVALSDLQEGFRPRQ